MGHTILLHLICIWLFLIPIMLANATPVLVRHIPFLAFPVWTQGLGSHKTWRGFFFGTLVATVIGGYILSQWEISIMESGILHFWVTSFSPYALAFCLGLSALIGDSVKSYRKRRRQIPSWAPFFPWDQIDYIIGACLLTSRYINRSFLDVLFLCILWWLLSSLAHYSAYLLGMINTKQ